MQSLARILGLGAVPAPAAGLGDRSSGLRGRLQRSRWVVGLILLLVLAMLAAAAATILTTREYEMSGAERGLSQLSLSLSEHVERTVSSLDLILTGLQTQIATRGLVSEQAFDDELSTADVYQMLHERTRDVPNIDGLIIINREGKVINFSRGWPVPPINIDDRDYFRALHADPHLTSYLSEPLQSRSTGQWTVYLIRPLNGPDGEPLGWVAGALLTTYFEDFFAQVAPGRGSSIALFRRDGLLLAHYPKSDALIGKSFGKQPLFSSVLAEANHGIVRTPASVFDAEPRIMASWVVDRYPLIVNITDLQSNVLAQWAKLARAIAAITAVGLLLALALGAALMRQYRLQAGLFRAEAKTVSLAIAEAEDFEAALMVVLRTGCGITEAAYAEAWIPDADGTELVLGPVWHVGLPSLISYAAGRRRRRQRPGSGHVARAWQSQQPVWASDRKLRAKDPGMVSRARQAGLLSAYAVPIVSGTEVLAVLRFGMFQAEEWDKSVTESIDAVAAQLGTALRQKRVEQALRESEQMARDIVATALDAFIQIDESGLILEWNPRAEALFGWSRAEALGVALTTLIVPPGLRRPYDAGLSSWLQIRDGGIGGRRFEAQALTRDGKMLQVELAVTALKRRSGYVFNTFLRDLTDKIAVDQQLRQAQKMEAVGNLTGGLAHDFNNLLGVIIGNLEIVRELVPEDEELNEVSGDALEAAQRGADLVRRLLAFARRQPLKPQPTDANALIAGVAKLLRRTLGEHIEFELKLARDLWPIRIDPAQLEAAITNLATNARDAMPKGGLLTLTTENVRLDGGALNWEAAPGDYVRIEVADTGCGMSGEVIGHIFEPFFTTKEEGKGSGLGLSMVFGFIKQSGGHVTVTSEPGQGSILSLYLPRIEADLGSVASPIAVETPTGGGETLLVVEDNEMMRQVVVRQLATLGYRTIEAENAAAAIDILSSDRTIDMLFTDVVMPGAMDGFELASAAQRMRPGMKKLLTSGFPETKLEADGLPLAASRLLSKPYTKEQLARAVRETLDGPNQPVPLPDGAEIGSRPA